METRAQIHNQTSAAMNKVDDLENFQHLQMSPHLIIKHTSLNVLNYQDLVIEIKLVTGCRMSHDEWVATSAYSVAQLISFDFLRMVSFWLSRSFMTIAMGYQKDCIAMGYQKDCHDHTGTSEVACGMSIVFVN